MNHYIIPLIVCIFFLGAVFGIVGISISNYQRGVQHVIQEMEVYSDGPVRIVLDGQEYWHNR